MDDTAARPGRPAAQRLAQQLAQQLAQWLEGLGLVEQLGAAGLPTFQRAADGTVTWTDPGTGRPLTREQLDDLDRLLRQQGDDPAHAVPVALVQLRRLAQVRERLLASEWLDYESLALRRGASVNATRFAVHKASDNQELLVVPHGERVVVPGFQLTDEGRLRPELEPVLRPLLDAGMDPWRVWGWLTEPAGLLGGLVPQEVAGDPEHSDVVRRAARALAERSQDPR